MSCDFDTETLLIVKVLVCQSDNTDNETRFIMNEEHFIHFVYFTIKLLFIPNMSNSSNIISCQKQDRLD